MCDASDYAMEAILGQSEDGKPYVVYYASKTLNDAQKNYTTTENELLVVVFTLDIFKNYLLGTSIIKLFGDVFQMMNNKTYYECAMRELMEVILLRGRLQQKFYIVDSIGQLCSRIVTLTTKVVHNVNNWEKSTQGVEPKNGSTGQPVVLVRSSTGQGRPKSFSLSQWPSLPPVKVILFPVEVRSRTDRGKLRSKWNGPYVAKEVFPYDTMTIRNPMTSNEFKVNGQRLKHFIERFETQEENLHFLDGDVQKG
ncbi:hypothetical protein CK203_037599 [Vitis vinifera]|uniref:Reverse transcriptase RNase H-like domain-containing protein n=1 Tax=Vitis vinifera TaxID=29760 RepID=A0A438HKS6_VITVI|nr:hypothetical protein CK203_037599 [Vitis vinifera]